METRLVIETLQDSLSTRTVADGLILHSDRGSQYTSKEYTMIILNTTVFDIPIVLRDAHTTIVV